MQDTQKTHGQSANPWMCRDTKYILWKKENSASTASNLLACVDQDRQAVLGRAEDGDGNKKE
jgi:hypothetical protein